MASNSGFKDSNDTHPDLTAADSYADQYISQFFDCGFFGFEDTSLFEQPLPFPTSPGEFDSIFSPETQPNISSMQAVLGPSNSQPQTTAIPLDNDVTNHDAWYKGLTEVELRVVGSTRSSTSGVAVPTLPPSLPSPPSATGFPLNWIKVPQKSYDHGRKQSNFKRLKPVSFGVGGRPGVNLGNALRKEFVGLDGRDEPVLQDAAGAISCRLLFPGYPGNSGSCQIHVLDWTKKRQPITRSKLAHEVARKLERYLRYMAKFNMDKSVETRWAIGQGFMHIDNMFLVHLVSVSKGSFQPEIWVADHLYL